jgi:hypothetical protein
MLQIIINVGEELTDQDREILALVTGTTAAPAKTTAAKKTAPAKPEPESEAEDDLLGSTPTMADAVALATKLVSAGDSQKVKDALAEAGAKRVSELAEDKIAAFVAALS